MTFDAKLFAKACSWAAFRYTPRPLRHWLEDIAQDVAVYVLLNRRHSQHTGGQCYRWAAQHAVRRLCFILRGQAELAPDYDEPGEAPHELGPFPMWRLQRVWDDLTDLQRLAVTSLLSGDSLLEASRQLGCCASALHRARNTALARIDEPAAFRRGREYQRTDLTRPRKPVDPAVIAARKARDARDARAARARARSAA